MVFWSWTPCTHECLSKLGLSQCDDRVQHTSGRQPAHRTNVWRTASGAIARSRPQGSLTGTCVAKDGTFQTPGRTCRDVSSYVHCCSGHWGDEIAEVGPIRWHGKRLATKLVMLLIENASKHAC